LQKIAYSINHPVTQSLTHSPGLFDAPGTEVFALEKQKQNKMPFNQRQTTWDWI